MACKSEEAFTVEKEPIDIYLVRLNNELESKVFEFASILRNENLKVEFDYLSRSVKAQMREANKYNSRFVLFIGGEEYENGQVQLKNMESGEQQLIGLEEFKKF